MHLSIWPTGTSNIMMLWLLSGWHFSIIYDWWALWILWCFESYLMRNLVILRIKPFDFFWRQLSIITLHVWCHLEAILSCNRVMLFYIFRFFQCVFSDFIFRYVFSDFNFASSNMMTVITLKILLWNIWLFAKCQQETFLSVIIYSNFIQSSFKCQNFDNWCFL